MSVAGLRVALPAVLSGYTPQPRPARPVPRTASRFPVDAPVGAASRDPEVFRWIVGNQEISQRAGVSKALVHSWTSRPHRGFPAPIVTLAAGPLYWWPEIGAWLDEQAQVAPADRRRRVLPQTADLLPESPARPSHLPLVGVGEIGARAGVESLTVCNWRRRYAERDPRFPAWVVDLAMGPIYWWPDVQQWLTATGRPAALAGVR